MKSLSRIKRSSKKQSGPRRRGTATVELAVCLPILFILSMGAMEGASLIFLRQALVQSAYETVKESVRINGSQADGLTRGEQVLSFRNIQSPAITFSPSNVDSLAPGTPVTVTVTAPGDSNSVFPFGPFLNKTITVRATMLKE